MARKNSLIKFIESHEDNIPEEEFEAELPDIPDNLLKEADKVFKHYIFFNRIDKHTTEYTCTACGEHFTVSNKLQREMDSVEQELFHSVENSNRICPRCYESVQLKSANRGRKKLREIYCADFVIPVNKNTVVIRGGYLQREYDKELAPKTEYSEISNIILTPGDSRRYRLDYSYRTGKFVYKKTKTIGNNISGIALSNGFFPNSSNRKIYKIFGLENLKKTYLKYAPLEYFSMDMPAFLSYMSRYPIVEQLIKAGYEGIIKSLVYGNKKQGRTVDWNAKSIDGFFKGLNPSEYKQFCTRKQIDIGKILNFYKSINKEIPLKDIVALGYEFDAKAEFYKNCREDGITPKKAMTYCSNFYISTRVRTEFPTNSAHRIYDAYDYLLKQKVNNRDTFYADYLNMAKELHYDLSVHNVLFPKNLVEAHDNAMMNHSISEETECDYAERYEKLKEMYEYHKDGFAIIVPRGIVDIVREGRILSHCVGGYAHRHIKGDTTILFLRKTDDIDSPLYTIDIEDRTMRVRQIEGYKNNTPLTKEASAFFEDWKQEIVKRAKKKKRKKVA